MQAQNAGRTSFRGWLILYRWWGILGFSLAPCNVIAAYEAARGWDMVGWFEGLWPLGLPWALFAFSFLAVKDSTPQHRVSRFGMVVGLATWLATITDIVIWRAFEPILPR